MPSVDELTRRNVETIAHMERAAEEGLTRVERLADTIAHTVGSWPFLIGQTTLILIYLALNVVPGLPHWDPYPFTLLNLFVAFEAAYMGPIIMMSQNRQAKIAERRNHLDLQINLLSEQENTEMLQLLRKLCDKAGIDTARDHHMARAMEQPVEPEALLRQISEVVEGKPTKES